MVKPHATDLSHMYYVVDVDIKGFFDNINHGKLLRQMWSIGIRDKKVISIISAMLKAEVAGIGFPEKGTPQGGIISPLLANIVLNELDWWISDQWQTFELRKQYSVQVQRNGTTQQGFRLRAMRDYHQTDRAEAGCNGFPGATGCTCIRTGQRGQPGYCRYAWRSGSIQHIRAWPSTAW